METGPGHQDAWSNRSSPPAPLSLILAKGYSDAPVLKKRYLCNRAIDNWTLEQMGFMPESATEPMGHSTTSNTSGSFGCQPFFASGNTLQTPSLQLLPIGSESREGPVPVLPPIVNSLPNSAAGTPTTLNPWTAEF